MCAKGDSCFLSFKSSRTMKCVGEVCIVGARGGVVVHSLLAFSACRDMIVVSNLCTLYPLELRHV